MNYINRVKDSENRKKIKILMILIILIIASYISIFSGIANISFKRVLTTYITKINFENIEALSKREMIIFLNLRLSRVFLAIITGFALAICGTIMQSITENKMSSPFTTGISSAASMGAAFAILYVIENFNYSNYVIVLFAFFFSLICSILVYSLSLIKGMSKGILILVGIAFNYLFSAGNAGLQFIANDEALSSIVNWTFGNLSGISWEKTLIIAGVLFLVFPYFYYNSYSYNSLIIGEDSAISLGVNVKKLRIVSGFLITLLTSTVISFIGVVAFVGIIAPHIARILIGNNHRHNLFLSGLVGAILMVVADYIGRTLVSPVIIPVGIVISFVGIPIFIYLIINSKRV